MADIREMLDNLEESLRVAMANHQSTIWTAMPVKITEDSKDGHTTKIQPLIKGAVFNQKKNEYEYQDLPVIDDVPIHYQKGGQIVHTFPTAKDDEALAIFSSRPLDTWHQSGDSQQPIDTSLHSLSDAIAMVGLRSTPNKIKNWSKSTAQLRSVDGKQTFDVNPGDNTKPNQKTPGSITMKTVDPEDKAENPWTDAKKFFQSLFHGSNGMSQQAVNDQTKHEIKMAHDSGIKSSVNNEKHYSELHPTNGVTHSAEDGKHVASLLSGQGISLLSSILTKIKSPTHSIEAQTNITGDTNIDGFTNITKNLGVGGLLSAASFGGGGGSAASFAGGLISDGPLSVLGNATLTGDTHVVDGDLTINGNLIVNGNATVNGALDVDSLVLNSDWTPYVPELTSDSGTLTTAAANGAYLVLGKMVFFYANIDLTNPGSAVGLRIGLPFEPRAGIIQVIPGIVAAGVNANEGLLGKIGAVAGTFMQVRYGSNGSSGLSNIDLCVFNGTYWRQ
jgi:hypothetical protein